MALAMAVTFNMEAKYGFGLHTLACPLKSINVIHNWHNSASIQRASDRRAEGSSHPYTFSSPRRLLSNPTNTLSIFSLRKYSIRLRLASHKSASVSSISGFSPRKTSKSQLLLQWQSSLRIVLVRSVRQFGYASKWFSCTEHVQPCRRHSDLYS